MALKQYTFTILHLLKQHTFIILQLWRLETWPSSHRAEIKESAGLFPFLETWGASMALPFLASWGCHQCLALTPSFTVSTALDSSFFTQFLQIIRDITVPCTHNCLFLSVKWKGKKKNKGRLEEEKISCRRPSSGQKTERVWGWMICSIWRGWVL